MMISFRKHQGKSRRRGPWLALVIWLGAGISVTPAAGHAAKRRSWRPAPRVVSIRQVIIRREPVVIQAVTLAQLRAELRRARATQAGHEREIAQQYQTIRRLQAQLDTHLRELRDASSQRAGQLDAQYGIILQAVGLVIFAIMGALLLALSHSRSRPAEGSEARPARRAVDWDPLQQQLREAMNALATVERRLGRLETSISHDSG